MTTDPDTPRNHLTDRRYSSRAWYTPPKLVVCAASDSELVVWRMWAAEGRLPQVAVEILGALLAERGEDA